MSNVLPLNQIVLGDCTLVLKNFPENSIDCLVTDPPYGLSFMGKAWGKALPPKRAFVEMVRVLKPGALAFVMSSPRQDLMWRMAQLLEESGFELGQSFISWVYASGFPKAYDLPLGIDSKFIREEFEAENGRQPTREELKGLLQEKRKTIGIKSNPRYQHDYEHSTKGEEAGHKYGKFKEVDGLKIGAIIEPASPEAKKWSGWKAVSGLKPALEVIFMVQKPLSEKTIVDNVLKWGTGAMNVDACRIPIEKEKETYEIDKKCRPNTRGVPAPELFGGYDTHVVNTNEAGRFPANLLVSDDALNDGKTTKSNIRVSEDKDVQKNTWSLGRTGIFPRGVEDSGSFSRYFDLDAWSRHYGFLNVPKASTSERDQGLYGFEEKESGVLKGSLDGSLVGERGNRIEGKSPVRKNLHPTVKPVELMAYLIELGCPPSGVVLDPFLGSGTTCVAARMLGRDYIGIEISVEYHKIAVARVGSTPRLTTLDRY